MDCNKKVEDEKKTFMAIWTFLAQAFFLDLKNFIDFFLLISKFPPFWFKKRVQAKVKKQAQNLYIDASFEHRGWKKVNKGKQSWGLMKSLRTFESCTSLVHLFTCLLVHLFTCSLAYLFTCSLVHLFSCFLVCNFAWRHLT